jgi:hypothetical protein
MTTRDWEDAALCADIGPVRMHLADLVAQLRDMGYGTPLEEAS